MGTCYVVFKYFQMFIKYILNWAMYVYVIC